MYIVLAKYYVGVYAVCLNTSCKVGHGWSGVNVIPIMKWLMTLWTNGNEDNEMT
jgi:hypothetical protein